MHSQMSCCFSREQNRCPFTSLGYCSLPDPSVFFKRIFCSEKICTWLNHWFNVLENAPQAIFLKYMSSLIKFRLILRQCLVQLYGFETRKDWSTEFCRGKSPGPRICRGKFPLRRDKKKHWTIPLFKYFRI